MKKAVFTFILLLLITFGFSQGYIIGDSITNPDTGWLSTDYVNLLKDRKAVYKKPSGFTEVPGLECFEDNREIFDLIVTCLSHQLLSKDGHFIAFLNILKLPSKQDSVEMRKLFPNTPMEVDNAYISQIRGNIKQALGDSIAQHWRQYVTFYAAKDAKRDFNADTVISFHLQDLNPTKYYKGKYKYIDALFLQKEKRNFLNFYFFYDDEAKKHIKKYLQAIVGTLRYEN